MRTTLLSILAIFIGINTDAQYYTISGRVLSESDSSAIIYANISVNNSTLGTITNDNGEFLIYVPDSLSKRKITFSSIGFENLSLPIVQLKDVGLYYLKPKIYNLNDITILPIDGTPKEIVKKCFKNINKNYPTKKHLLKCFYRETTFKGEKAARLIEAAVDIQNYGVGQKFTRNKIKINQFRKSDDNLDYSIFSEILYNFFGKSNMIYETFESYAISNKNKFKEKMNKCEFQIERFEMLDTLALVVIKYADSTNHLWINYGYLHIDVNNYSILKSESFTTVKDKYKQVFNKHFIGNKDFLRKTTRIYQQIEKKYYLKYIEYYRAAYGTAYNEKHSDISYSQLLINDIKFTKKEYDKIKNKEASSKKTDLYDIDYTYNPNFWKNYNILLANPIQKKIKKDLEKQKTLETQFKENSKQ